MKKIISLVLIILPLALINGQQASVSSLQEEVPAVVYSLPKTTLNIDIEVEKTTTIPGVYFQYSERYLATDKVITEEKTTYKIKTIKISSKAIPDPARTYNIPLEGKSVLGQISVNADGLLCGVNVPVANSSYKQPKVKVTMNNKEENTVILPLGEEYMMAGSTAKLAEGAAKQIYRIRESRISLLTGDLEHLPADGASFKAMLDGMNKMEKQLTELFIGKTRKEIIRQHISVTPDVAMNNMVLFRFSVFKGVVAVDDLSGEPYYLNVNPEKINISTGDVKGKKAKPTLFTILPAKTSISISDSKMVFSNETFLMPQFGVLMPLSEDLFSTPKLKIHIDSQTGRLLYIEK
ncbi:MAG: DUF4831 family protein [Paludibacter sp.]|nr:DUF4831 family protein [Paludibacter sp.]